ncbi:hypothetical protein ACTHQ8_05300 [Lysinibacillus odysseyi]|uniref:hypothetical protein n=1 Tax=Lysinibacillus odysseyi TaxID=202611 RepID=UPI0012E0027D|nr:hypothetical protein [Lysinibacillus odysseyi]
MAAFSGKDLFQTKLVSLECREDERGKAYVNTNRQFTPIVAGQFRGRFPRKKTKKNE